MMNSEPEYINKKLWNIPEEEFNEAITNDFIGTDFIEQLEWAMLMTRNSKFSQFRAGRHLVPITRNTFNKAYLLSASLKQNLKSFRPHSGFQATPEMFPNLNIKSMIITDTIQLLKVKDITKDRFALKAKYPYLTSVSVGIYKKDDEDFYCHREGYGLDRGFFNIDTVKIDKLLTRAQEISDLIKDGADKDQYVQEVEDIYNEVNRFKNYEPHPISLTPGFKANSNSFVDKEHANEISMRIAMAYNLALSLYYEWSVYLKEDDNMGFVIPIEPSILKEMFTTSMLKFGDKKRMLQFVRDHYRRKRITTDSDYSVYVKRYLRGENKFNYLGFSAEIIPPKYDLNRAKTRKKITETLQ